MHICYLILMLYLAWEDWQTHRIRHLITLPAIATALIFHNYLPASSFLNGLVGGLFLFLLFGAIGLLAKAWYGHPALRFGDVMLAWLIGSVGGVFWGTWGIALGMVLGGFIALIGLWIGRWQRKTWLPYGTFIALGMASVLAYQLLLSFNINRF